MISDSAGNLYVIAPVTSPSQDIEVVKLDPSGKALYTFAFGGSGTDQPGGAALDSASNLYITGTTDSTDFPLVNPLPGTSQVLTKQGVNRAGFIVKIDPTGSKILFSTKIGGAAQPQAAYPVSTSVGGIALDPAGNLYVTGSTSSADFPTSANAFQKTGPFSSWYVEFSAAFVMKIPSALDSIAYSTFLSGTDYPSCAYNSDCTPDAVGGAIAVDENGIVTVSGYTSEFGFPTTPGAFQSECYCSQYLGNAFVTRLNADASSLMWSTLLGPGGTTPSGALVVPSGNILVYGTTTSANFPTTPGALQPTATPPSSSIEYNLDYSQIFLTWLDPQGQSLAASTYLGGSDENGVSGLVIDAAGHLWLSGTTNSPDFPLLPSSLQLGNSFIAEISPHLDQLLYAQRIPTGTDGILLMNQSGALLLLNWIGSLLTLPPNFTESPAILGMANSADYTVSRVVSPGALISFYGVGLGPNPALGAVLDTPDHISTSLGGVSVTFDGIPSPLLYAGPNQINAIVPFEVAGVSSTAVHVTSPSGLDETTTLSVVDATPFPFYNNVGEEAYAAALNQDGTVNSSANPAQQGSIVSVFANGAGVYDPPQADGVLAGLPLASPVLPVSVIDNFGRDLPVLYAGAAPGLVAGVLQVNLQLPQDAGNGGAYVSLRVGTHTSYTVGVFTSK
jgi:uncharacterized protein (TIGR03437 family)